MNSIVGSLDFPEAEALAESSKPAGTPTSPHASCTGGRSQNRIGIASTGTASDGGSPPNIPGPSGPSMVACRMQGPL